MIKAIINVRCSAMQNYNPEKGCNPDLYDAILSLDLEIEELVISGIGLNWTYEKDYFTYLNYFHKLKLLDLSFNHLGGPEFEKWLVNMLLKYPDLRINMTGNPYCTWSTPFASKWRERVDKKLQERIITH